MPPTPTWQQVADLALYASLVAQRKPGFESQKPYYDKMLGVPGKINLRTYQNKRGGDDDRLSIDCSTTSVMPKGHKPLGVGHHQWAFPDFDTVMFWTADMKLLGKCTAGVMTNFGEYLRVIGETRTTTTHHEESTVFHTNAVRTKAGWKAQVVYGDADNNGLDELPVVWESDDVYVNDTEGDKKESGSSKAYTAAGKAIDKALEALFSKIKV